MPSKTVNPAALKAIKQQQKQLAIQLSALDKQQKAIIALVDDLIAESAPSQFRRDVLMLLQLMPSPRPLRGLLSAAKDDDIHTHVTDKLSIAMKTMCPGLGASALCSNGTTTQI